MSEEVQQRLDVLQSYLESDSLSFEGRLFARKEIWDMKIATAGTVTEVKQ